MVNISDRWNRNKTDNLQFAFFNGVGWESWENIWGIWNGITPRDGEATRRMATIERGVAPFLVSQRLGAALSDDFLRRFCQPLAAWRSDSWTIVNRNEYDVTGRADVSSCERQAVRYFDLYHGVELQPEHEEGKDVLSFAMEAHGFGAILATTNEPDAKLRDLMKRMKAMTAKPLSSFSNEWKPIPQQLVEISTNKVSVCCS